jgi:hypothetical protein
MAYQYEKTWSGVSNTNPRVGYYRFRELFVAMLPEKRPVMTSPPDAESVRYG